MFGPTALLILISTFLSLTSSAPMASKPRTGVEASAASRQPSVSHHTPPDPSLKSKTPSILTPVKSYTPPRSPSPEPRPLPVDPSQLRTLSIQPGSNTEAIQQAMKAFSHNPSPNLDLEGRTPTISDAVKDNSPLRSQSTEPQRPQVNYSQLRTMTVPPNSDVAAMRAAINAFLGDREVNMANQKADQDGSG